VQSITPLAQTLGHRPLYAYILPDLAMLSTFVIHNMLSYIFLRRVGSLVPCGGQGMAWRFDVSEVHRVLVDTIK